MSALFMMFMAVNVNDIAYVRSLGDQDIDPRTGTWKSSIPKDAMTLVWLRHGGYLHVSQPFPEVMESLSLVADLEGHR